MTIGLALGALAGALSGGSNAYIQNAAQESQQNAAAALQKSRAEIEDHYMQASEQRHMDASIAARKAQMDIVNPAAEKILNASGTTMNQTNGDEGYTTASPSKTLQAIAAASAINGIPGALGGHVIDADTSAANAQLAATARAAEGDQNREQRSSDNAASNKNILALQDMKNKGGDPRIDNARYNALLKEKAQNNNERMMLGGDKNAGRRQEIDTRNAVIQQQISDIENRYSANNNTPPPSPKNDVLTLDQWQQKYGTGK